MRGGSWRAVAPWQALYGWHLAGSCEGCQVVATGLAPDWSRAGQDTAEAGWAHTIPYSVHNGVVLVADVL